VVVVVVYRIVIGRIVIVLRVPSSGRTIDHHVSLTSCLLSSIEHNHVGSIQSFLPTRSASHVACYDCDYGADENE
jgi:hypothetical protein